jgi:hypothetical protein
METDERNIQIGLDEMAALVLEALLECSCRLDEGTLGGTVGDARKMLELWRNDPDRFGRLAAQGAGNAYEKLLKTVKGVLSRHGIEATRHDPITGQPSVETSSGHNARMAMRDTVEKLRSRILAAEPGCGKWLPENGDDSSKLMKPTAADGKLGLRCSTIGSMSRLVASLDGRGVTVEKTGSREYGYEPDTFTETDWFITLPDGQSGAAASTGQTA